MRFPALDAVRGLAALTVVLFHCVLTLPPEARATFDALAAHSPLRLFQYGRSAVMLFFVLSGFVLALQLAREARPDWMRFTIRRVFRIYPAFVAALCLSVCLFLLLAPPHAAGLAEWVDFTWSGGAGPATLLDHLLLRGRKEDTTLDSVIWSLVYEMRISLIFPALLIGLRLAGLRFSLVATALLALAADAGLRALGVDTMPYHGGTLPEALLVTAHFTTFFAAGALLAMHRDGVLALLGRAPWPLHAAGWLGCLGLLVTERFGDYGPGVAALGIIALAISSDRAARGLTRPPLAWLGKVSYSLYLLHVPVLMAVLRCGEGRAPLPALYLVAVVISLALAEICFQLVEQPGNEWGRRIAAGVRDRRSTRTAWSAP